MLAVAHARAAPSIGENAVDLVHGHDLADHAGHELEVVGAERAGYPGGRHRPMAARLAVGFHGDPVRMCVEDILVRGVRIHARDDVHAEFAAAGHHFAKRVAVAEELAAVVQRNLSRIEGHASARAEADRVGVNPLVSSRARRTACSGPGRPPRKPVAPIASDGRTSFSRGSPVRRRPRRGGRRQNAGLHDQLTSIDFHNVAAS